MKFARLENAHTKSAVHRSGGLYAFVHEPKPPIPGKKIYEPNTCGLMATGKTEQGKERVAHPLGQSEVTGIELTRFVAEECIEGAPTPLFRLEKSNVRKHLGCFVAFGQNDLSVGAQLQGFRGSRQVKLCAHSDRCAQNRSDGCTDRAISS
jgi:hypothetical protein